MCTAIGSRSRSSQAMVDVHSPPPTTPSLDVSVKTVPREEAAVAPSQPRGLPKISASVSKGFPPSRAWARPSPEVLVQWPDGSCSFGINKQAALKALL